MRRRLLSLFLCLCMTFSLLPTTVLADDPSTGIWVGDTDVSLGGYWLNDGAGGITTEGASATNYNVHYNNGVLTLKDANITKNHTEYDYGEYYRHTAAVYSTGSLEINLIGENELIGADYEKESIKTSGIDTADTLTISGSGSLEATGGTAKGYYVVSSGMLADNITISGGTIAGTGGNTTAMDNNGSTSIGIYALNKLTISGGTVAGTGGTVVGIYGNSMGMYSYNEITISGGSVTATGGKITGKYSYSYGFFAFDNINISGGFVEVISYDTFKIAPNLKDYPDPYTITASMDLSGSSPVTFNKESLTDYTNNYQSYDYFRISPLVYVGETEVTAGGYWHNDGAGGITTESASADSYNVAYIGGILTIKDANITKNHAWNDNNSNIYTAAVYSTGSLIINLLGENMLIGADIEKNGAESCGIYVNDDLAISGSGSLEATGGTAYISYGIFNYNDITISGGSVTATGGKATGEFNESAGLYCNSSVTISGGIVNATGGMIKGDFSKSYGVYDNNGFTISGGSVTATGGEATGELGEYGESVGFYCDSGGTISGGIINATGGETTGESNISYGVYGQ